MKHWTRVKKTDPGACELADRHYSRRKPGSGFLAKPGEMRFAPAGDLFRTP